jgi:hypothetical protein
MKFQRAKWLPGLLLLCLAAGAGYYFLAPAPTPAGQLSLTSLDRSGFEAFERMFDDAADRVRVVALLSPT